MYIIYIYVYRYVNIYIYINHQPRRNEDLGTTWCAPGGEQILPNIFRSLPRLAAFSDMSGVFGAKKTGTHQTMGFCSFAGPYIGDLW